MAVEATTTEQQYSAEELREAGASPQFIRYYEQAHEMGEITPAVKHVESEYWSLSEIAEAPYAGGGFFEALWSGEPRYETGPNPYGADSRNTRILEAAGIY